MVGSNRMKDWKRSVGTWERRQRASPRASVYERTYTEEELEKRVRDPLREWMEQMEKEDESGDVDRTVSGSART